MNIEIPVQFVKSLEDVHVKEKDTAVFTCELNKENAPVKWAKDGTDIYPDEKKYKFSSNGNKYSLEIFDAKLSDICDYSISLRGKKSTANLYVEELPVNIIRPLQDVTVYEKNEIHLECEFEIANLDSIWYKDNTDIKYALGVERCYAKTIGRVHQLVVLEARLDDYGKYSCAAKLNRTNCEVKVLETPVEVVKPLENQEVVEKQTAVFQCTLNKPRLKVTWYKNNIKLAENDRIKYEQEGKVYKLIINNSQLEDKASYKIKIEDGPESNAAKLNVIGKF